MEENVEVAEVRVCDLVLPPVEHVLHALVSTVDGLAQDKDGSEADHEYSLLRKVQNRNCFQIADSSKNKLIPVSKPPLLATFPYYFPSF